MYLDPIADKGLLLSGIITLSISNWSQSDPEYGSFPAWFPVLVISRDVVILVGTMLGPFKKLVRSYLSVPPQIPADLTPIRQSQPEDIFIVGYPKSGNTWFQNLISGIVYVTDGVRQLQAEGHAHPQRG